MIAGSRNRVERWLAAVVAWFRNLGEQLGHIWRRSLQLRVVVSTLTLSLIVITILGVVLTSQITDRLLDAKINAAVEEMSRARNTVQSTLSGVHDSSTPLVRLDDARRALSAGSSTSGGSGGAAGSYDSALAMYGDNHRELTAGPIQEIPPELRHFVQSNQVSYQFATITDSEGRRGSALIIGSPSAEIDSLEIYLVFPLSSEERSLSLMRGTMLIGGVVLLVLLAAITALVTRQVVLPIRSAARIASRFADGRLKERMLVRGEDDMARLAMAFNEMAESLSNQITQLEEFGNLQRRFTSDVSHELRTPLTTVRMAADLIHGSSDDLDPALARSAELLVNELDRFEGLLNDLLEISRHDAGVAELQVESLDVRMCARAAVSTVRHLAKETGVELVVDMPEEPLVAEVDPRRVERVLRNLLANAIDHSEGKPVLMRVRGDADANSVAFVVRDQGVGLRPGEEKMVFNRFWRSDPSRVRRSGGTGLGLSISVEDANLHDGKLEAWGETGVGASFRLTLPLVRGRKLGASPLPLEPPKRRGGPPAEPPPPEVGNLTEAAGFVSAGPDVPTRPMTRVADESAYRTDSFPHLGTEQVAPPESPTTPPDPATAATGAPGPESNASGARREEPGPRPDMPGSLPDEATGSSATPAATTGLPTTTPPNSMATSSTSAPPDQHRTNHAGSEALSEIDVDTSDASDSPGGESGSSATRPGARALPDSAGSSADSSGASEIGSDASGDSAGSAERASDLPEDGPGWSEARPEGPGTSPGPDAGQAHAAGARFGSSDGRPESDSGSDSDGASRGSFGASDDADGAAGGASDARADAAPAGAVFPWGSAGGPADPAAGADPDIPASRRAHGRDPGADSDRQRPAGAVGSGSDGPDDSVLTESGDGKA